jgi:DNA-binding NtrC family response regulator
VSENTLSSISLGRGTIEDPLRPRPTLIWACECDEPLAPSSRHLLDEIDVVTLGRGPREARRIHGERRLDLRVPDRRMSGEHCRLERRGGGWLLEDLRSKNGCIVNGALTPRAMLAPGDVVELGHTFFLYADAPAPPDARPDMMEGEVPAPAGPLVTFVASLERQFAALARIADTAVSVVLLGETGTGKEIVARALHEMSRRPGPFVAVNCGALPESLLESELFGHKKGAFSGAVADRPGFVRSADTGTLFLDEIGELPPPSQVAFLRVLQEQEVIPVGDTRPVKVDSRLCAATHRDLDAMVEDGQFRRDLYARIFGFVLELPPLRHRRADMGILLAALLRRIPGGERVTLTPAALRAMLRHDWPLNVRELEKCLVAAIALAGDKPIELDHLPPSLRRRLASTSSPPPIAAQGPVPVTPPGMPSIRAMTDAGTAAFGGLAPPIDPVDLELKTKLVELLTAHDGNVAAVARAMGKGRMQIHRWARRFGIELESFRR